VRDSCEIRINNLSKNNWENLISGVQEASSCYTSEIAPGRATRGVAKDEKLSMTQSKSSDSAFASSAANLASMKLMSVSLTIRFDSKAFVWVESYELRTAFYDPRVTLGIFSLASYLL
jgi:hypothetical protein